LPLGHGGTHLLLSLLDAAPVTRPRRKPAPQLRCIVGSTAANQQRSRRPASGARQAAATMPATYAVLGTWTRAVKRRSGRGHRRVVPLNCASASRRAAATPSTRTGGAK